MINISKTEGSDKSASRMHVKKKASKLRRKNSGAYT